MKKFIVCICFILVALTLVSCTSISKNNVTTDSTTKIIHIAKLENNLSRPDSIEPIVLPKESINVPDNNGVLRLEGVTLTSSFRNTYRAENVRIGNTFSLKSGEPLSGYRSRKEYRSSVDKNQKSEYLVIADYNLLKEVFDSSVGDRDSVLADDIFPENIFEENIVIAADPSYGVTGTPFYWFDCNFNAETNEFDITPVRKKTVWGCGDISIAVELYFVVVPKYFLPEGYNTENLIPKINNIVKLEDSSTPEPWNAGTPITVYLKLNSEDNYEALCKKYNDGTSSHMQKVYGEIYDLNCEYIKKIGLDCKNVIISEVGPVVYVKFESVSEFLNYQDYFKSIESSEYVKKIVIT